MLIPNCIRMVARLGTFMVCTMPIASFPTAAGEPDGIVFNRQSEMKEIASAAKTIAAMFKTPETYSSVLLGEAARTISDRADQRLLDHFSTIVVAENSKASADIVTDQDRFAELAANLKLYSSALAEAAERHPDAMTDEMRMKETEPMEGGIFGTRKKANTSSMSAEHLFHMILQTCTTCHSRFRAE